MRRAREPGRLGRNRQRFLQKATWTSVAGEMGIDELVEIKDVNIIET